MASAHLGPSLPVSAGTASMVNDPQGGVIFIGGTYTTYNNYQSKLYQLANAGSGVQWQVMVQALITPRMWLNAFLIPDSLANCA